ncbi:MAG: hypothetical protein AAFN93_02685 [Bacteroidota bacterium]
MGKAQIEDFTTMGISLSTGNRQPSHFGNYLEQLSCGIISLGNFPDKEKASYNTGLVHAYSVPLVLTRAAL